MLQMSKHYETEFKKIVRLYLEEGRTLKGLVVKQFPVGFESDSIILF